MLGKGALVVLTYLSRLVTEKLEETLSHVRDWVSGRIEIAVASYYSRMVRGTRLPSPPWDRELDWYPVSGLVL